MKTRIRRIGNSRGVVLPADILDQLGLDEGDELEIATDAYRLVLREAGSDHEEFFRAMEEVFDEDDKALAELARR